MYETLKQFFVFLVVYILDNLNTIGGIIITSTSEDGEKIIKQEILSITDELNKLFDGMLKNIHI